MDWKAHITVYYAAEFLARNASYCFGVNVFCDSMSGSVYVCRGWDSHLRECMHFSYLSLEQFVYCNKPRLGRRIAFRGSVELHSIGV